MQRGQQHNVAALFLNGLSMKSCDLHKAYIQSAHIISKYGDKYLPIFERIEREYNSAVERDALLTKAKNIAIDNTLD